MPFVVVGLLAGPGVEAQSFTTTEGTWISVDLSPSGHTIVFDLLGDIYSLPAAGGVAARLIGGRPFESQP